MPDQRPVHLEVNCTTGAATHTPMGNDEWDAQKTAETQALADEQASVAADKQLAEAVAAHPDPVVRELARRLGMTT